MFTQDDADRALEGVAIYLNTEPGELRIVQGDPTRNLIFVTGRTNSRQAGSWIYQCDTGTVYPVNGFEDPNIILDVINEARA